MAERQKKPEEPEETFLAKFSELYKETLAPQVKRGLEELKKGAKDAGKAYEKIGKREPKAKQVAKESLHKAAETCETWTSKTKENVKAATEEWKGSFGEVMEESRAASKSIWSTMKSWWKSCKNCFRKK